MATALDLDVLFKAAALLCNIAWAAARAALALPGALLRCAAVDCGVWRPRDSGSAVFYEGTVQHSRSKPAEHQFTCARSRPVPWPPVPRPP